jgi:hypothetical protein
MTTLLAGAEATRHNRNLEALNDFTRHSLFQDCSVI